MSSSPVFLDDAQVSRCLENKWSELILLLENAFQGFSARDGSVVQPVRSSINVKHHDGLLLCMAGYSGKEDCLASKLVTIYPNNSQIGIPAIQSTVLLMDSQTGAFKAIMNGNVLTQARTAAASAVATKYLAPKNPKILAILGAGVQAKSHYHFLSFMYKFDEVRVWNIRPNSAKNLVEHIKKNGHTVHLSSSVEEAVKNADIIVVATLSKTPVLEKNWVKPGAHINAVGACAPDWQELSSELMNSSTVYVDSLEGALEESGDIIISKAPVYAEIGQVIKGTHKAHTEKTTVFKSLGMAIEDVVAAKLVYEEYQRHRH